LTIRVNVTDDSYVSNEANTLPNLQTLIEEVRAGFASVNQRLDRIESRVSAIEHQLENMDIRLDGMESFAHQTRSEVLGLRKDFKEHRLEFDAFRNRFGFETEAPQETGLARPDIQPDRERA
jgi:archaellum component FlaC